MRLICFLQKKLYRNLVSIRRSTITLPVLLAVYIRNVKRFSMKIFKAEPMPRHHFHDVHLGFL